MRIAAAQVDAPNFVSARLVAHKGHCLVVLRDGRRVVGYGFNSNGRYGQGGLINERFAPRLLAADPESLLDLMFGDVTPWLPTKEKLLDQQMGFYYLWK